MALLGLAGSGSALYLVRHTIRTIHYELRDKAPRYGGAARDDVTGGCIAAGKDRCGTSGSADRLAAGQASDEVEPHHPILIHTLGGEAVDYKSLSHRTPLGFGSHLGSHPAPRG